MGTLSGKSSGSGVGQKMYKSTFSDGKKTSSTEVGTLKGYDANGEAIIQKDATASGPIKTETTFKLINPSKVELDKYIQKYGSVGSVEKALNAKGYTLNMVEDNAKKAVSTKAAKIEKIQNDNFNTSQTNQPSVTPVTSTNTPIATKTKDEKLAEEVKKIMSSATDKNAAKTKIDAYLKTKGVTFDWSKLDNKTEVEIASGDNQGLKGANKAATDYLETATDAADKKKKIRDQVAEDKTDIVEEANDIKEKRLSKRLQFAKDIADKFVTQTEERKAEIDKSVEGVKAIQSRQANIAVAKAGQGAGMTEGERAQVEADAVGTFATNVNNAEMAAIQNKSNLDSQAKGAKVEEGMTQDQINSIINGYTDDEFEAFKVALDQNGGDYIEAINTTKDLVNQLQRTSTEESFNRFLKDKRIDEQEADYDDSDVPGKAGLVLESLYDQAGSAYITETMVKEYINSKPNATLKNVLAFFRSIAQHTLDKVQAGTNIAIQDKSVIDPKVKSLVETLGMNPYALSQKQLADLKSLLTK